MRRGRKRADEQSSEITKASQKPSFRMQEGHSDMDRSVKKQSLIQTEVPSECIFSIPHRKDSVKTCKGKLGKLSVIKALRRSIVSDGMDVKEFRKNIDQTNERAASVNGLLKFLDEFDQQFPNFAKDFILSLNSLLEFESLLSGDSRRQQELMYFLQENLDKLKLVIPALQRHCKLIQTLVNDTSRVEERLATYVKAIYQFSSGFSHISMSRFEGLVKEA